MRGNPLIAEIGSGLGRGGQAQLDYLKLMLLQAVVLVLWWPKSDVAQMLPMVCRSTMGMPQTQTY